jgi:thiamine-monophosphate kinase
MAGEFALIDKYFARPTPSAILGPGDDCALVQPTPGKQLAVTTDMLVPPPIPAVMKTILVL